MIPLPTVFATPSLINAPTKLPTAATKSACFGLSAFVSTEVAIALAAS